MQWRQVRHEGAVASLPIGALVLLLKVVVAFAPRCGRRMTVLLSYRLPREKRNITSSMFHQFVIACQNWCMVTP